jgi:hypothetical protein
MRVKARSKDIKTLIKDKFKNKDIRQGKGKRAGRREVA